MSNTDADHQGAVEMALSPNISTENSPLHDDWENALQQFGVSKTIPSAAIFNAVFIPHLLPERILLTRATTGENIEKIKEGVPDHNFLLVCVMDSTGNFRRLNDLVLPNNGNVVNWEDVRVWQSYGGQVTLGITAIISDGESYRPCPALVKVGFKNDHLEVLGNPKVFKNLAGKNVVPLEDGFICRFDIASHKLYRFDGRGTLLNDIDFSRFNEIPWLSKKVGTTARPIELADHRKILLIHGIQGYSDGVDGTFKDDIYSLGIAVLDENWQVLAVDSEPILKRSHFLKNLRPEFDRDPHKEVVYLCDWQLNENIMTLPVNVGDRLTVFTHIYFSQLLDQAKNILSEHQSSPLFLF